MKSGTQLINGEQEVLNDASSKEDKVDASLVMEDNHSLCREPKENFLMGNGIASTEADTDPTPSMLNEELPQQDSPAFIETTPACVEGETIGVASQVQEDNRTLPSWPKDEYPVENENASTEAKQMSPKQNAELPQENAKASIDGSKGVKAEVLEVASQIQQDSLALSSEPLEEFLTCNGNTSTEAHVEETPTQNGEFLEQNGQALVYEGAAGVKTEAFAVGSETGLSSAEHGPDTYMHHVDSVEPLLDANADPSSENPERPVEIAEKKPSLLPENTTNDDSGNMQIIYNGPEQIPEPIEMIAATSDVRAEKDDSRDGKANFPIANVNGTTSVQYSFNDAFDGNESGTEEEQGAFMKELESFFRDRGMEFKPPRFYRGELNCLKLWRSVIKLGGYDRVTSCKLWRQVGESFRPPKTCTTVSWTFRIFYEKALLEYERHKALTGELDIPVAAPSAPSAQAVASRTEPTSVKNQIPGSGRARRDAAARAMQGWHSQRLLGNGEVSDPIIKDKNSMSQQKREKQQKTPGLLKRKKPEYSDYTGSAICAKTTKPQLGISIVDIGPPADWVKINVQKTKDCFEVYALVPGLLREEVRVQSDPAGRLVISGEPEHLDNPWGVTAFKKVVTLSGRIDPHQTSAVVTLHGQLFIRVPFAEPKTV